MPRSLFIVAAHALASRCEQQAHGDSWDEDSALLDAARENMEQPVTMAMVWPLGTVYGGDDSDHTDASRFGHDAVSIATSIDGPPNMLRDWGHREKAQEKSE